MKGFMFLCLVFFAFMFSSLASYALPADSVRLEVSADGMQAWIIHEVEPKETLYSLAKRYGVSVEEIQAANPTLKSLRIGDLVRIPYKQYKPVLYSARRDSLRGVKQHIVQTGETLYRISKMYGVEIEDIKRWNNLIDNAIRVGQVLFVSDPSRTTTYTSQSNQGNRIVHEVQEGEYLYAIARRYGVRVSDLKNWNQLDSENLSVGQKLLIYPQKEADSQTSAVASQNNQQTSSTPTKPVPQRHEVQSSIHTNTTPSTPDSRANTYDDAVRTVEVAGYKKIIEKGMGEVIEDQSLSSYVGLHRDAPIGAIVAVKNQSNGENVFVRIIGNLPTSETENRTIIKISKAAYEALGAQGKRFPVEVSYIP